MTSEARRHLPRDQRTCIEAYERQAGVPFCTGDFVFLDQAFKDFPKKFILESIKYCAGAPENNPGYDLARQGMERVLKNLKARARIFEMAEGKDWQQQQKTDVRFPDAVASHRRPL